MNRRFLFVLPLVGFAVIAAYFAIGLTKNPRAIPSVLIDTPVPEFSLDPLKGRDRGLSSEDLTGEVSLVNVFGSWCFPCRIEHPLLMQLRKENAVPIHGIDWREADPDDGPKWLAKLGDPYTLVGDDPVSRAAIAFGVTGAPETFVIDKNGIIRYKHVGVITGQIWEETLRPLIEELRRQ